MTKEIHNHISWRIISNVLHILTSSIKHPFICILKKKLHTHKITPIRLQPRSKWILFNRYVVQNIRYTKYGYTAALWIQTGPYRSDVSKWPSHCVSIVGLHEVKVGTNWYDRVWVDGLVTLLEKGIRGKIKHKEIMQMCKIMSFFLTNLSCTWIMDVWRAKKSDCSKKGEELYFTKIYMFEFLFPNKSKIFNWWEFEE